MQPDAPSPTCMFRPGSVCPSQVGQARPLSPSTSQTAQTRPHHKLEARRAASDRQKASGGADVLIPTITYRHRSSCSAGLHAVPRSTARPCRLSAGLPQNRQVCKRRRPHSQSASSLGHPHKPSWSSFQKVSLSISGAKWASGHPISAACEDPVNAGG